MKSSTKTISINECIKLHSNSLMYTQGNWKQITNNVCPGQAKSCFLTVIGTKNYTLLSDYYAPDQPKDQSLENLIATLKAHFEPEPIIIAERFLFYDALRDQFVCGIYIESIHKELLTKKTLSMEEAVKQALSLSSAEKNSRAMQAGKISAN